MEGRTTAELERRYRRCLGLYPRGYREERGEEILQTLLELGPPGRRWPVPREVGAMAVQGLRLRTGADVAPRRPWLAALPLTACLLMVVRIVDVLLVMPAVLDGATTRAAANVALVAWPALPAALVLVAVHRRWYRLAVVLAAVPVPVDVLLMVGSGSLGTVPGSPVGLAAVEVGFELLPVALLLPLVLPAAGAPVARRWQLRVPVLLAAPAVGVALVGWWPGDHPDGGLLAAGLPVLAGLALLGVLAWGALVDGCVALSVGLCLLVLDAWTIGRTGALTMAVPWEPLAALGGAELVLALVGAWSARRQAVLPVVG